MNYFYELMSMGADEDARSWVFRLARYGIFFGILSFLLLGALATFCAFLLRNTIRLRREVRAVSAQLAELLRRTDI